MLHIDSDKDQMALSWHYSKNHSTINKPPLHEAYTATFVEQPSCHSLGWALLEKSGEA